MSEWDEWGRQAGGTGTTSEALGRFKTGGESTTPSRFQAAAAASNLMGSEIPTRKLGR